MSDLEFSAGLDLSDAVSAIDDLAANATAQLSEVAQVFSAALAEISVGDAQVAITADIAPAQAEVADLVATTDAQTATISVDADTGAADAAVSDLGDSLDSTGGKAEGATKSVGGFGESAALVGGSAALARGEVGGLGEVVGGVGLGSAAAIGGVAALGGSIFELASKGIAATSAEQRFNTIVGETKDAIEKVQVGSLTADLAKLGIQFGSTDTDMKNSASSLFQFALNSGASREEAAKFTDQVVALSARAVSLNPQLGTLGDVSESLGVKIARGGRFAASYGIALTAAEINTRALTNTQKSAAGDLTIYEKATAATQLAVEKYGSSLGSTVAEGAKNAANEQKSFKAELEQSLESLGKPLVAPLFDAIKASLPDVVAIARPLGEIGVSVLPAIAAAAGLAAPPLKLVADAIHEVPGPVLTAAAAVVILSGVVHALAASEVEGAASTGLFGGAVTALGAEVSVASIGIGTAVPLVGAFVAGFALTTAAAHAAGFEIHSYADLTKTELTAAQNVATLSGDKLTAGFKDLTGKAQAAGSGAIGPLATQLKAFRDIAEVNITKAVELANSTDHNTTLYKGMEGVLKSVSAANADAGKSTATLTDAQNAAAGQVDITAKAFDNARARFGDYVTQIAANVGIASTDLDALGKHLDGLDQSTSSAFNSATSLVSDFSSAWGVSTDAILGDLDKQVNAATKWSINLTTLAQDGIDQGLIEQLRTAGPKAEPLIDGLLQAVADGNLGVINTAEQSLRTLLGNVNSTLDQMEIDAAVHLGRINEVSQAKLADLAAGGTANLDRLREGSDTELAAMATEAEHQMGRVGESVNRLPDGKTIVITADVAAALASIATVDYALATTLSNETPEQRRATLEGIAYSYVGAEGAYITAQAGGASVLAGEAGTDEVLVSPRDIPSAIANLSRLGVLNKLVPPAAAAPAGAATTGGGGGIVVQKVVLEQASPNPVREAMTAAVALRKGAALVALE